MSLILATHNKGTSQNTTNVHQENHEYSNQLENILAYQNDLKVFLTTVSVFLSGSMTIINAFAALSLEKSSNPSTLLIE